MRPWELVDHDGVPDDDGTLFLMSRGSEWVIHVDGKELMGTGLHGSEVALADEACDRLPRTDPARILVGGLGMGFTLAAALRRVGPGSQVTVAELLPAVVRWNREHTGRAAGHPLRDPRAIVYGGDVGDLVHTPPAPWSAILLDVDNGPGSLTRPTNGWLYTRAGLRAARRALIKGGVLGIWSAHPFPPLPGRLRSVGFSVAEVKHTEPERPTADGSGTHVLWMATAP